MVCSGCGQRVLQPPPLGRCPDCGAALRPEEDAALVTRADASGAGAPDSAVTRAPHDVSPADAPVSPEGTPFGRYLLREALGSGAMGAVWSAWDPVLQRPVAIKQMRGGRTFGPDALARFLREARLAAGLRHPGIVRVLDAGAVDGCPFLAMEQVDGETLEAVLERSRPAKCAGAPEALPALCAEVARLAEVAEAVGYAHAEGVLHRDLKPGNILIDRAGRAVVSDFGLARETEPAASPESRLTRSGQIMGTPAYMSPELADGDHARVGPASDVWALGVVLYETLTGRLPFEDTRGWETFYAVLHQEPRRPRELYPHAPAALEAVCRRALDKEPARRYATGAELAADLRRWVAGEAIAPGDGPAWGRPQGRGKRIAAALAALLAFAAFFAWHARTRERALRGELLAEVAAAVASLEDRLGRTEVPAEGRRELALQALGPLERLLALDPDSGLALAWRGQVRALVGDHAEAARDFDRACASAPEEATVWLLRGLDRVEDYMRKRPLPAWSIGPMGIQLVPSGAEPPAVVRLREEALADLARAEAAAQRAGAEDERIRTGRAAAALFSGRAEGYQEAADRLDGIEHPRAWRLRGIALHYLRRNEEAAACLDRALAEWPLDLEARIHRGQARMQAANALGAGGPDPRERFARAIEDFEEAARLDPDRPFAVDGGSTALTLLAFEEDRWGGDPCAVMERAVAWLDATIAAHPDWAALLGSTRGGALNNLGRFLAARGRDPLPAYRRSLADLEAAVRARPGHGAMHGNLGLARLSLAGALRAAGEDPEPLLRQAILDLTEGLRLDPTQIPCLRNRAVVRLHRSQWERAHGREFWSELHASWEDCREYQRRDPPNPWGWHVGGITAAQLAEAAAARNEDPLPYWTRAEADLRKGASLGEPRAHLNLAQLLAATGRLAEAADAYEAAARALPAQGEECRRRAAELRARATAKPK